MDRIEVVQLNIDNLKSLAARHGMSTFCILMRAHHHLISARATRKGIHQNDAIRKALGDFWFARGLIRNSKKY